MLTKNPLMLAFTLGILVLTLATGTAAEPKINNLAEHLAKDSAYQKKTTLDKLTVIAGFAQKNQLQYNDKTQEAIILELVKSYMTEKGKDAPNARLIAFAELKAMTDWKKPLARLRLDDKYCALEFATSLNQNTAYQNGDSKTKVDILTKMIKNKTWSSPLGTVEAELAGVGYIEQMTGTLTGTAKFLESLKILSGLKEQGLITWGNTYSGMERVYLMSYLSNSSEYRKMTPDEKVAHLAGLEKKKLIMSFIQSDMESVIVTKKLMKDTAFMALSQSKQAEHIDTMANEKKIHTFSKSKIKNLLGLPRS